MQSIPQLSDRDSACLVLPDLDYDSQLAAIQYLLRQHKKDDKTLRDEIKRIEQIAQRTTGLRNEHAVNEWMNHVHASIFQDAAHSMAAVGMLAPLIESMFYQAFHGIRQIIHEQKEITPINMHIRWKQATEDQWDCHYFWSKGKQTRDLVKGILQLAEAVELSSYLPSDLKLTLQALFEYRNKMFHNGFEWPLDVRQRFQQRINDAKWPQEWFSKAEHGDNPWIFYLTDIFINHILITIDNTIKGIGAFCNNELLPYGKL